MAATRAFADLLAAMSLGERPTSVQIQLLSDLDRGAATELASAWKAVPGDVREDVLVRATELAEDNVDLDFSQLARIGMDDDLPSVRRRAIEAAWDTNSRDVPTRIAALVTRDPDESVRAQAASALRPFVLARELGTLEARTGDAVVDALRYAAGEAEASVDVRARAVESLGSRTLPWVDTLITDAYYADDRRLRLAAIRAMGESAQESWIEFLEEQADSDDPEFRYEAAVALGGIGTEEALPALTDMLGDEDREVVLGVLISLGEIGGEEALEALQEFQEGAPEELREAVRDAIEAAQGLRESDLIRRGIGLGS